MLITSWDKTASVASLGIAGGAGLGGYGGYKATNSLMGTPSWEDEEESSKMARLKKAFTLIELAGLLGLGGTAVGMGSQIAQSQPGHRLKGISRGVFDGVGTGAGALTGALTGGIGGAALGEVGGGWAGGALGALGGTAVGAGLGGYLGHKTTGALMGPVTKTASINMTSVGPHVHALIAALKNKLHQADNTTPAQMGNAVMNKLRPLADMTPAHMRAGVANKMHDLSKSASAKMYVAGVVMDIRDQAEAPVIKSARTKAALAGILIQVADMGHDKSAGLGQLATGAGKLLSGRTLIGAGKALGSAGSLLAEHPNMGGAAIGGVSGGILGHNQDNTWNDTFRNMGIGAGVGAAAGQFGSKPLGALMQRGGGALARGSAEAGQNMGGDIPGLFGGAGINTAGFGQAAGNGLKSTVQGGKWAGPGIAASGINQVGTSGGQGLGARWLSEGTGALNAANTTPGTGATGWLNKNVTARGVNMVPNAIGSAASHMNGFGKNWMPWMAGGALWNATGAPAVANAGGERGATEAEAQMANQYQNMPFLQRMMLGMNPEAMTAQLPQAAQQRLQQLRAMAPGAGATMDGAMAGMH